MYHAIICGLQTSVNQYQTVCPSCLPCKTAMGGRQVTIPLCTPDNELAHVEKIDVKQKGEIVLKLSFSVAIGFHLQKSVSSSLTTLCYHCSSSLVDNQMPLSLRRTVSTRIKRKWSIFAAKEREWRTSK